MGGAVRGRSRKIGGRSRGLFYLFLNAFLILFFFSKKIKKFCNSQRGGAQSAPPALRSGGSGFLARPQSGLLQNLGNQKKHLKISFR